MSAWSSLVAHSRGLLPRKSQADHHPTLPEQVRPCAVHQAIDTAHPNREEVDMVAMGEEKMMSMCHAIITPDHGRLHRGGVGDRTAIQDLLHERPPVAVVHLPEARPEGEEEVLATVLIAATVGAGAAREVDQGVEDDMDEGEMITPRERG